MRTGEEVRLSIPERIASSRSNPRIFFPKSSIPALEGILIEAGEQLRLTGYNLETGIRAAVPAEIREKGSLVLSARLFGEIIRKMPDDVVVFTSENYMVNIKCGLSEFNILGTDPEEFPELPSVEEQNGLTIGQPVLRSMIAQTLFAVSDNESRPVHTGSLFEVDESGLTVVSVDGYRLALGPEPVDSSQGVLPFSFVVPGSALSEVEKICAGEDAVSVAQGARHIQFQAGDTVLVCRRLEGEFLAYKNAIPRNNTIKIEGDARTLLNLVEYAASLPEEMRAPEQLRSALPEVMMRHDKDGDSHYELASALIKSIRGSDPDAALYYLACLLEGGEDPRFICRRLILSASEDVGLADPNALPLAVSCQQAVEFVGMPEGFIPLAETVVYLALARKSNSSYAAYLTAAREVKYNGARPVPLHLRNASTQLQKEWGYGKEYKYPHNYPEGWVEQDYLPAELVGRRFYQPRDMGDEARLSQWWRKIHKIRKTEES